MSRIGKSWRSRKLRRSSPQRENIEIVKRVKIESVIKYIEKMAKG